MFNSELKNLSLAICPPAYFFVNCHHHWNWPSLLQLRPLPWHYRQDPMWFSLFPLTFEVPLVFLSVGLQSKGEIEELELLNRNSWEKGVVAEQLAGGLEVSLFAGYGTIVSSPVMFIFL